MTGNSSLITKTWLTFMQKIHQPPHRHLPGVNFAVVEKTKQINKKINYFQCANFENHS